MQVGFCDDFPCVCLLCKGDICLRPVRDYEVVNLVAILR